MTKQSDKAEPRERSLFVPTPKKQSSPFNTDPSEYLTNKEFSKGWNDGDNMQHAMQEHTMWLAVEFEMITSLPLAKAHNPLFPDAIPKGKEVGTLFDRERGDWHVANA
jgi:hypothetical protein